MVVSCEEVWREISDYLDDDVTLELHAAMEDHFRGCRHCSAVKEGTSNMIHIFADERMFELPSGFSQRLQRRLGANLPRRRGTNSVWIIAFATAALVVVGFEVGDIAALQSRALRSEHARPAVGVPPVMMVVVSDHGRTFHEPGCSFIHDKHPRGISAAEAVEEGYSPCPRCMRRYLQLGLLRHAMPLDENSIVGLTR